MPSIISKKIADLLASAGEPRRVFPATTLYNEGWLLRLVLDWFSLQPPSAYPLSFYPGATWFSEGLLPTRFSSEASDRRLAEGSTHADGVVGHVSIGLHGKADVSLVGDARQLLIAEAKLASPLTARVTNAPHFDQAARSVSCIAQLVSRF